MVSCVRNSGVEMILSRHIIENSNWAGARRDGFGNGEQRARSAARAHGRPLSRQRQQLQSDKCFGRVLRDFPIFQVSKVCGILGFPSGTTFVEYTTSAGFCWAPQCGGANTYAMNGFMIFRRGGFGIPANVMFRITLDATKGALWEYISRTARLAHIAGQSRHGGDARELPGRRMSGPSGGTWTSVAS